MLVLGRKEGQVIYVGRDVQVTVCEIRGGIVRLGFTAPREVPIEREEVRERRSPGKEVA
jgi:carbon storage regulator